MEENKNWVFGRSAKVIEQDIRQTLAGMSSEDIAKLDADYKAKHNGIGIREAILEDDSVSKATKDAVAIYLKGKDKPADDAQKKVRDEDTLKLAQIALENKNLQMFEEAMKDASPEARKRFVDEGGDKKLEDAFAGHWYNAFKFVDLPGWSQGAYGNGNLTDQELRHAQDYARDGKLSAATQVNDNAGVIHWTNNDKGIENAFSGMTQEERERYFMGRALASGQAPIKAMSDQEKERALAYYRKTHEALADAGNDSETAKWEDMIAHKEGSLVSKLASHHGSIYNDSRGDTLKDIENMSETDWKYAREQYKNGHGNEYRERVKQALETLRFARIEEEDVSEAMTMFDEKMRAGSYEESQKIGRKALLGAIDDDTHWYKNDRKSMVESISHMSEAEQEAYRTNKDGFRDKLREKLEETIEDGPALKAANRLLDKVDRHQSPEQDVVTKLYVHDGSTGDAVRSLEEALRKDPKLIEHLRNPQTKEEQEFSSQFNEAIHGAMSEEEYERYTKPLVETGKLDITLKMELNKSLTGDDEQQALKDLAALSPEEKQALLAEDGKLTAAINWMDEEDQKVARAVIQQKEGMQPEDKLRSRINHWGGASEVMETLKALKPEELNKAKVEYRRKYGGDLESDLLDKLDGENKAQFKRMLVDASEMTAYEKYNEARDEYYRSRDGFGSRFVEGVGNSGTGYQLDDAINQYAVAVEQANSQLRELTPEQTKELQERVHGALDNFKESKGAAAEYLVNGVVIAGGIAGAIVTGGAGVPLIAGMAAAGGIVKLGAKAAILGSDYDTGWLAMGTDALTGMVDGATGVIGPGEVAAILKVGEKAAAEAAKATAKKLGEEAAKRLLKEGGEEALEKGTKEIMQTALAHGADKIEETATTQLAEKLVKPVSGEFTEQARAQAVKEVADNLHKNLTDGLKKETESWLVNLGRETALNVAGGSLGGGASGLVYGVAGWDPTKTYAENMKAIGESTIMSAGMGGVMGGGMTLGMKGLGAVYHGVKGHYAARTEAPHLFETNGTHAENSPEMHISETQSSGKRATEYEDSGTDLDGHKRTSRDIDDSGLPKEIADNWYFNEWEIPAEKRAEMLERARRSVLHRAEAIDDFVDRALDRTLGWEDLSQLAKDCEQRRLELSAAYGQYKEQILDPLRIALAKLGHEPEEIERLTMNVDDVRHLLGREDVRAALPHTNTLNPTEHLGILDQYTAAREAFAGLNQTMSTAIHERTQQLQELLDNLADQHHLPRVRVQAKEAEGIAAYYDGQGVVSVNPINVLSRSKALQIVHNVYHEFVHNEQDALVIRYLAHMEGVGHSPDLRQIETLQARYLKETGSSLSPEYLQEALRAADGRELSGAEVARAAELVKDQADHAAHLDISGNTKREYNNDIRVAESELSKLRTISGEPESLLIKLDGDKGVLSRRLFGTEELPPEIKALVDAYYDSPGSFSMEKARELLAKQISEHASARRTWLKEYHWRYMDSPHEQEALVVEFSTQARAEAKAQQRVVGNAEPATVGDAATYSRDIGDASGFDGVRFHNTDEQTGVVASDVPVTGRRATEVAEVTQPSVERILMAPMEGRVVDKEEFLRFTREHGLENYRRGTYRNKDRSLYLYDKGFTAPTAEQAINNLQALQYMTEHGILYPGSQWGIYRAGPDEFRLFATTRALRQSNTLTVAELRDIHVEHWLNRIEYDSPLRSLLNPQEALHPENWGIDPDGNLFPIDVEVIHLGRGLASHDHDYDSVNRWLSQRQQETAVNRSRPSEIPATITSSGVPKVISEKEAQLVFPNNTRARELLVEQGNRPLTVAEQKELAIYHSRERTSNWYPNAKSIQQDAEEVALNEFPSKPRGQQLRQKQYLNQLLGDEYPPLTQAELNELNRIRHEDIEWNI